MARRVLCAARMKRNTLKLVLSTETLRALTAETLDGVRGGTFRTENCRSAGTPCNSQCREACQSDPIKVERIPDSQLCPAVLDRDRNKARR